MVVPPYGTLTKGWWTCQEARGSHEHFLVIKDSRCGVGWGGFAASRRPRYLHPYITLALVLFVWYVPSVVRLGFRLTQVSAQMASERKNNSNVNTIPYLERKVHG